MKSSSIEKDLVQSISFTFWPAKLLGFFNIIYDPIWNRFIRSSNLYIYNRWVLVLCNLTVAVVVSLTIYTMKLVEIGLKTNDNNSIQEGILWFCNFLQLWLVIFATAWNHEINQSQLEDILNGILKCRRSLVKLIKKDAPSTQKRVHWSFVAIRLVTIILDIYCTAKRPYILSIVTLEYKPLVYVNKLVMGALFCGWCFIQTHLIATFQDLNYYVHNESVNLRAKDCQALSKILTKAFKIKRTSSAYYGLFMLMTYSCLIRTVSLWYNALSVLLLHQYNKNRIHVIVHLSEIMLISGVTPIVDVLVQGQMVDHLVREAEKLRWGLLTSECKSIKSPETQRCIDNIMRQEFCEDIKWASGAYTRPFAFAMIFEAVSWVLTLLVYDSDNALIFVNAFVDLEEYSMRFYSFILVCGLASILICIKLFAVLMNRKCAEDL